MDPTLLAAHEQAALALTLAEGKVDEAKRALSRARNEQTAAGVAYSKAKKALHKAAQPAK